MAKRQQLISRRDVPGFIISVVLHVCILVPMALVTFGPPPKDVMVAIESLFQEEDRTAEEFTKEMDKQEDIAESVNFQAGGMVTGKIGGSESLVVQEKVQQTDVVKDPKVAVNVGVESIPGIDTIGNDLGPEQIAGEVGALVEGYGAALDRMSQELVRLMREQKVLVVWLFDESESMKDDQAELKTRIYRIYEELKLVDDSSKGDTLMTAIMSYGEKFTHQTNPKKPVNDPQSIMQAIENIPVDKTGKENTCQTIITAINQYRDYYKRGKRKLVIIVVSDESGDDGVEFVDEALHTAKQNNAAIYFMGRESVFGNLYAYIHWVNPVSGGLHYLPIRRGPETPFAEQLPFDGFKKRMDASMSGFGPYEQVRLARDTGGVFFMLPNEEENIHQFDQKKYAGLDMREYVPNISSRRDYAQERDKSDFRKAIWDVIALLNPFDPKNKEMEIPIENWYGLKPAEYGPPMAKAFGRCMFTMGLLTQAQTRLDGVKKQRDKEPSRRWRANYDLILGQIMAYRVRLFQYMLALDQFGKTFPKRRLNDKSNAWAIAIDQKELLKPDAQELKATNVSLKDMEDAQIAATKQFELVQKEHPNTPWAARAAWEMNRGFGMQFREHYFPPPPKNPPPSPPAPPPPNL